MSIVCVDDVLQGVVDRVCTSIVCALDVNQAGLWLQSMQLASVELEQFLPQGCRALADQYFMLTDGHDRMCVIKLRQLSC